MRSPRKPAIAVAFALVLSGCEPAAHVSQAPAAIQSALPPSGVSRDRAIQLAHEHTSSATLVSVEAGRFGDLNTDSRIGPGYPIKPDDLVWAVQFSGDITICDPNGVCYSPRPSTTTVYLDYATGEFKTSSTFSPAN